MDLLCHFNSFYFYTYCTVNRYPNSLFYALRKQNLEVTLFWVSNRIRIWNMSLIPFEVVKLSLKYLSHVTSCICYNMFYAFHIIPFYPATFSTHFPLFLRLFLGTILTLLHLLLSYFPFSFPHYNLCFFHFPF